MVMDNLGNHKCERVRELIGNAGCELLYLPPYSPDLNPIEEAFSKVNSLLRQTENWEVLVEATGKALDVLTTTKISRSGDAPDFIAWHHAHRGKGRPARLL